MSEWVISSGTLILLVAAVRFVFRDKLALRLRYALWIAVALRLLVPFSLFQSDLSVLNLFKLEEHFPESFIAGDDDSVAGFEEMGRAEAAASGFAADETEHAVYTPIFYQHKDPISDQNKIFLPGDSPKTSFSFSELLICVWLVGALSCGGLVLAVNHNYKRKLYRTRKSCPAGKEEGLPVYFSGVVKTPCIFGLIHPSIYLPENAAGDKKLLEYVLTHEKVHFEHRDHVWSLVRAVCICLHWYNPLVWIAGALSRQDGELACDEAVIERLGEAERIGYGRALLEYSVQKNVFGAGLKLSTAMSGGKKQLKERIVMIARHPKCPVKAVLSAVLLVALCLAASFTGRKAEAAGQGLGAVREEIGRELTFVEVSYSLRSSIEVMEDGTRVSYGGYDEEEIQRLAREALYELYELSGVKIETACFTVTWYGDFCFGLTEESVRADRTFYTRSFGFEETIPSVWICTERTVPDSPIKKLTAPGKLNEMSNMELAVWYFQRSLFAEGEQTEHIQLRYENAEEDVFVIKTVSGKYFEMTIDNEAREMSSLYGPYNSYPMH